MLVKGRQILTVIRTYVSKHVHWNGRVMAYSCFNFKVATLDSFWKIVQYESTTHALDTE